MAKVKCSISNRDTLTVRREGHEFIFGIRRVAHYGDPAQYLNVVGTAADARKLRKKLKKMLQEIE